MTIPRKWMHEELPKNGTHILNLKLIYSDRLLIWTDMSYILCIYGERKTIFIPNKSYIREVTKSNIMNYYMCWFAVESFLLRELCRAVPGSIGARFISLIPVSLLN